MQNQSINNKNEWYEIPVNIKKVKQCQKYIREWYFKRYCNKIKPQILGIKNRKQNKYVHESTIFGDNSESNKKSLEIAFKQRQMQMKEGEIAETILGNFQGWTKLKRGDISGMDIKKNDNSIIIEVKNKHNTVKGSDIKKSLYPTLAKYKNRHPETRVIWGIINEKPGTLNLSSIITFNNVKIERIQGIELFKIVCIIGGIDYSYRVIDFVKSVMY